MTLLREIQRLLETTYGPTGVNLEEFLVDTQRSQALTALAVSSAGELSDLGRVFLRVVDDTLRMGIYYDPQVIDALEANNPRFGLNDGNILPFMVFLEELDHAVHAALKFREGVRDVASESFISDLEVQARVDIYLILEMYCAYFNTPRRLTVRDRRWLRAWVFDAETFTYPEPSLARRYRQANRLSRRYVRYLDGLPAKERPAEIRRFRRLPYCEKQQHVAEARA